jgi:predicted naringenin-chalcone synthase
LSNSLFGDGAAAVIVESQPGPRVSLSMESFFCDLAPEGKAEMAWQISDFGFEMILTSYVPALIKGGIKKLAQNLLKNIDLQLDQVDLYAIHPGGRKILEVIEEELNIPSYKNKFSHEVLKEYGNMSSPTVLFVLNEIFKTLQSSDHQKNILSFAFGPGLTLESMLLKVYHNVSTIRDYFDYEKKEFYIC